MFLMLVLSLLSGCGGPRYGVLPSSGDLPPHAEQDSRVLKVGDTVRVTLAKGGGARGEVVEVNDQLVVIGMTGNYGYRESTFHSHEIESIELNSGASSGSAAKELGKIVLTLVVLGVGALLVFGSAGAN